MGDLHPYLMSIKPMKEGLEQCQKLYINNDEVTLGRSTENTHILPSSKVSRIHCSIKKQLDQWTIKDSSHNGILLNNRMLTKHTEYFLNQYDIIQLDLKRDFVYTFILPSDEAICIDNLKVKFEESQRLAVEHLEKRIQNTKQQKNNYIRLREDLENHLARKKQQLKDSFKKRLDKLSGEQDHIDMQRLSLVVERDIKLWDLRKDYCDKIVELLHKIKNYNEYESDLRQEKIALRDRLVDEKDHFTSVLYLQSPAIQTLLKQLTTDLKKRQKKSVKEKQNNELQNPIETVQLLQEEDTTNIFSGTYETQLLCTICSQLYIDSTALNCYHTFCEFCINKCVRKKKICPVCSTDVTTICRDFSLDVIINDVVQYLPEQMRIKREQIHKERQDIEAKYTVQATDDDISLNSIPMPAESYEEFQYTRLPGPDDPVYPYVETVAGLPDTGYSGFGRCTKCRNFGHRARGCPF